MKNLVWETRDAKVVIEELKLNCPYFDPQTETLEVICQGSWTAWLYAAKDPHAPEEAKFTSAMRRKVEGGEEIWFYSRVNQDEVRRWAEKEFGDLTRRSEEYWLTHDLISKLTPCSLEEL